MSGATTQTGCRSSAQTSASIQSVRPAAIAMSNRFTSGRYRGRAGATSTYGSIQDQPRLRRRTRPAVLASLHPVHPPRRDLVKLYKAMGVVAVLGAALLAFSYPFEDDEHGIRWVLGGIGWFGFLACVLALIVLALVGVGRGMARRAGTA